MTFAADLEREKAQQRTYDAMARKAKAGHVTGGRLFGYDNLDVRDASGQRSHVERQINETEAAVIRRIFELSVAGHGVKAITKILNAEGAPSPRAQRGRSQSWAPTSVRECSTGTCTGARSCGRKQPSETSGAGSDRPPGRSPTGFASPRLHSASSAMTSGRPRISG